MMKLVLIAVLVVSCVFVHAAAQGQNQMNPMMMYLMVRAMSGGEGGPMNIWSMLPLLLGGGGMGGLGALLGPLLGGGGAAMMGPAAMMGAGGYGGGAF
ncbi:hypothetical protein V1264_013733 [Littorina saxatilis]|uniref:Glycine-rich protein n=1 Tax=Littorina saxatilis TaxID=31220 RepID=A0AAN9GK78_9CAEN